MKLLCLIAVLTTGGWTGSLMGAEAPANVPKLNCPAIEVMGDTNGWELATGTYSVSQVGQQVIIIFRGDNPTPKYENRLVLSDAKATPPVLINLRKRPTAIVAQMITPYFVCGTFFANGTIESVIIEDQQGKHTVKIDNVHFANAFNTSQVAEVSPAPKNINSSPPGRLHFLECRSNEVFFLEEDQLKQQIAQVLAGISAEDKKDLSNIAMAFSNRDIGNISYRVELMGLVRGNRELFRLIPRANGHGEQPVDLENPEGKFQQFLHQLHPPDDSIVLMTRDDGAAACDNVQKIAQAAGIKLSISTVGRGPIMITVPLNPEEPPPTPEH